MPKITKKEDSSIVYAKTKDQPKTSSGGFKWWRANSKNQLCEQILGTVTFLKEQQQYRYRQASIYARLYGNYPLFSWAGMNMNKMNMTNALPIDRPTMNVVQSCIDTLVSRVTQARPRPVFLTENGNYRQRNLAKQMNSFIEGEFYQTGVEELTRLQIRDAAALGTGCLKIYESEDHRVAIDRVLLTELLVDPNDALYGNPRQLFQIKLVDKSVLAEAFPEYKSDIQRAENAFPDNSSDAQKTISDQIIIAEAWHLPSGKKATDGRHSIVCSSGTIFDEDYSKDYFPFVFQHYSPRIMGFWAQGLAEQLMGTQVEINKLLATMSQAINLVGVPRVFVEDGSKVVKAHLNNQVGSIVTYRGTKPVYEVAPCIPQEVYAQLERLVQYAYQQSGVSALSAAAQKPAGLNSGEAIRNYDDLQSDRFASLVKSFSDVRVEIAYQIIDKAKEIAEREGKYSTVYPNKDGTREIDLPRADLIDEPVIQCFDSSSLPRDPAGRLQKVTEMMQSGIIDMQEGRRLLDYPDIEQVDKLANAAEERILQILDEMVIDGKYTPPDPFMDPILATKLVVQYYNLYVPAKLEESKAQLLRDFSSQLEAMKSVAASGMQPPAGAPMPQAVPEARPVSDMMPQLPQS